jgi:hypothetical protein
VTRVIDATSIIGPAFLTTQNVMFSVSPAEHRHVQNKNFLESVVCLGVIGNYFEQVLLIWLVHTLILPVLI